MVAGAGEHVSRTHVYPMQEKSAACFNKLRIYVKSVTKGLTVGKGRRQFPIAGTERVGQPRNPERWVTRRTHCRDPKELPVCQPAELRTQAAWRACRFFTLADLERAI